MSSERSLEKTLRKKNKFNAKMVHGRSKKERERAAELKLMERAGLIHNLSEQVRFVLIPAQHDENGKMVLQRAEYWADFTYYDAAGNFIVEDVKGYKGGDAYKLYLLKKKLFYQKTGILIKET